jgi:hypothetical protein
MIIWVMNEQNLQHVVNPPANCLNRCNELNIRQENEKIVFTSYSAGCVPGQPVDLAVSWDRYKCSIWFLHQIHTACKQTAMLA